MNDKKIRYSDIVGVRVIEEDGSDRFIPYNAAVNSGLVSSGQDLANMQGPRYAFKDFQGAYSNNPANAALSASIKMDDTGKITVTVPEEWQDDEEIKKYTDSYMIDTLSKNYKSDKNVKYQDPYDETKQVTTEEYLKELNDALKFKVTALAATNPTKAEIVSRYGGTDAKNDAIGSMTVDDIIIMSAKFDEDDSWVPVPAYMLLAYPELETLESYTNGWVKKNDFLDNFYNIESGKITEANAYGIATTPEKMLSEIEDMSPGEIAKTIAFGNFISQVDPKRSNWQQFLQAGDALSRGFYGGFYDWFVETSDLITNIANFSWINGNTVETRDFWNGFLGSSEEDFDATAYMGKSMQDMAYTNKDALSKAQAGYVQGRIAGQLVDTVVSLIAVGEVSKALSNAITSKVTGKGAEAIALTMSEATDTSTATSVTTGAKAQASALANQMANYETLKIAATGSANYQRFFTQTLGEAIDLYSNALNGTALTLGAMDAVQFAKIVNSAARIATTANFANTAVNVLGTMVIAAVVSNKELTTKVLSSKATDSETKTWIQQVMLDSAKITALSYATNLAVGALGKAIEGTKAEQVLKTAKQKASQKVTSFTEKIEHPWLSFIKWYANNRAAASKVSNAGATRAEAIKEAVLANEARAYGANLSTEPGSYGMKIVQEALVASGVQPGVTMGETLDNLAKAGVVLDPANLNLSEYEAWQADYVGLRNALTNWDDVQTAVSQVVHEFTNADIYPTISQQMSEINKANGELLEAEQAEGLLSKAEIKKNKGYLKQDEGYIYAMHSPELSRYIVRGYELKVVANEGRMLGHENLNEYEPYKEALTRFQKASEPLSESLRKIADEQYVPALAKAESNILGVMVDAGVYPRAFVEAMRASGKFGVNGQDWLRLVARKKTPEGAYTPFSRMVKEDNTISINKFRILDDEDITWPGNGLQELIEEYGVTRAEKELVKEGKNATGKTSEIVVSGEKTRSAGLIKEYRNDFLKSVKQSINSFVQTVGQTVAVGKKRSAEQIEFVNDIATTGGIATIDIDALRSIMRDKNIPMADSIVDQETLDKFLEESSDEAKKVLLDVVGEKFSSSVVSDYQEPVSQVILDKRERIESIKNELEQLEKDSERYLSNLGWEKTKIPDNIKGGQRESLEKLKKGYIELGEKAAERMGFKGKTEKEFNKFYKKKRADLEKERDILLKEVEEARSGARDKIVFDGDLYPKATNEYIKNYKDRQKISDKYLGRFEGQQGGLADEWMSGGKFEIKENIRNKIEENPELRNALLSTMYANSRSKLPYEEWLDTPITLRRQQTVDSLREEDAFLSFSMRDDWQGINSVVEQLPVMRGDIITLEIKPKNTLGEIPKGTIYEDATELEVLVPREAYATAMSGYDYAKDKLQKTSRPDTRIDEYGVKVKKVPIGEHEAELDYTIADRISELNKAGYRTYNSHSGISTEHELSSDAGGGYIQFDGNIEPEKIEKIKDAAEKAGMGFTKSMNIVYGPQVVVRQSNTADQALMLEDVVKEANKRLFKHFNVPQKLRENGNWVSWVTDNKAKLGEDAFKWREAEIEKIYKEHGGYAQPDDAARNESWDKFFESLGIENTAENQLVESDILDTLKNEQYNKLSALKENSPKDYEAFLEKADRANAMENDAVRQSDEIQVAADEYRNSIKNFENQVIFNQKFSYIIRTTTETNTFKAFASENNIELGDGKGSAKSKLKSALWNKVINNEDLPEIKGLKKSRVKNIRELISALGGVENKTAEGVAIDDLVKQFKKEFYSMLDETPLFQNAGGPNPLKYELDEEKLYTDIEDAIGNMMERVRMDAKANAAIDGIVMNQGFRMSTPRFEFTVLSEILSKDVQKDLTSTIKDLAQKIVNSSIPKNDVVIKGNIDSLYKKVEEAMHDKLESRFATSKTTLESMGETAESKTVTELLEKYNADIKGAEEDPLVIKTMDSNGEIQYERVSPALASIYNERPTYSPMSTPMKVLNNLAILKKINTTDLSPRSFAKQSVSDPAMAFATVGGLPGTLHAIRDEIAYHFGPDLLRALEKSDPIRFENIKAISERENISMEEAFKRNSEALAKAKVPFTLLNSELLRQANISKFGNEGALKVSRKHRSEKINGALRRVSDLLGTPQNKRETYVRLYAGEKAYLEALRKGYNQDQAEMFREHALNTATTNFRTKHAVFNSLRSTVPYLTSGLSGAKSFWQMFELDPIGVTSRIVTGFIIPIIYFAGEIFSDENLKKKYEALAESEKENHIVMSIGGELVLIPVGEEIGKYTNVVTHAVEILYNENKYSFWSLMLNDLVSFIPGVDLTGFTDPEMLEPLAEESPSFLEVMDNGIAKVLAGVAPPLAQSMILGFTGRDLYTGRKIDSSYITIDEEGNPIIMSSSTSEFAKALAQVVGGDAKVIERAVSGTVGTVGIHVLDAITSAVQFVGSGGEDGSLTTAVDKTLSDLSSPFTAKYYSGLERRFNYAVSNLYRRKEEIEKDEKYIKYNQEISNEKDSKKRQNLINKRNELFSDYMKKVEALIKGYKTAGGSLDKWKLSKVTSLITFEDAVRADRQFMDLNTNYQDARKQAMQTLYNMGITNPDGPSSLGYIYTDNDGKPQLKMWTPVQMQIIQNSFYEQGNIHAARIKAIINDGSEDSLYNQKKLESEAEQPYWDKYNSTGKLSDDEWDAIDDLRKAYNAKVVLGLQGYMDTYGAAAVLNNDAVIDYLNDIIKVPSSYEKVKGRYVSSDNGKLNKQTGFAESYIKTIFGVK